MPFNIERFKSVVSSAGGLARSANFEISVDAMPIYLNFAANLPSGSIGSGLAVNRTSRHLLTFMAHAANLPGVYLGTHDTSRYGYGPAEKYPHLAGFNTLEVVFYYDQKTIVHDFISTWIKSIVNYDMRRGILGTTGVVPGQTAYEVAYKADYAVPMSVTVFNQNAEKIKKIHMIDAFPVFISDIPLNWAAKDSYMQLHASFVYRDWYDEVLMTSRNNIQQQPTPQPQQGQLNTTTTRR